jgi:rubrerythrin
MSRLTKYFADRDEYGHNSCHGGCESCTGVLCGDAFEMIKKLAHYEDLEDQLEKLYGGKLSLDDVVDNLNRIVQNGEEKLDYARILTNSEAEKWDYWKALEEQGKLMEVVYGFDQSDYPSAFECSVCGFSDWDTYTTDDGAYNYCPRCGAKMERSKNE